MKKLIYLLVFSVVLLSCKTDDDFNSPNEIIEVAITDEEFATANFGASIQANFIGRIVNEAGSKLMDVQITIGNETTMTDHNGVFVLNNASVHENFAFITATKSGYIQGSRTLIPTPNGTNDVKITLVEKNIVATVNSGEASEASLPNGGKVTFQGDFVDSSGNPYNGQVQVSLHYLEPNQEATFTQMPGMLFGQRSDGSSSAMETYGMLAVNLYASSGGKLNVLETSPATITFPVASSTPNAPESIPLWYFDEVVGYWKEQGVANRIGNEYIAEVTHFTWWNCDLPLKYINVCFELRSQGTLPNFHFEIIKNETNQIIFSGETNDLGYECGLFPKDEAVTINIYSDCSNEIIYTEVLGPYSSDTAIGVIVPSLPLELRETILTGVVSTCTGTLVTNGYAFLYHSNSSSFSDFEVISIVNGAFNYSFVYCEGQEYDMIVYDLDSGQSSDITNLMLAPILTNLGNILVCDNQVGGVFDGDIVLKSQEEIELFGSLGYVEISGGLEIKSEFVGSGIVDLSPLNSLKKVQGNLYINSNSNLNTLFGLDNLETVGGRLYISFNNILENLHSLINLTTVETGIVIRENNLIVNLQGLNNISNFNGALWLEGNSSLESLAELDGIVELTSSISNEITLNIIGNKSLTSLEGLDNVTQVVGHMQISGNLLLNTLSSLANLESVSNSVFIQSNPALDTLEGLNNLISIGSSMNIGETPFFGGLSSNLKDFCALQSLFANGMADDMVNISNNAYNPTVQDIIDGNCSQ